MKVNALVAGPMCFGQSPVDLLDWLDSSGLVIGVHYRDQNCVIANRPANIVGVDQTGSRYRQISNTEAFGFERLGRRQHGWMLDLCCNDMAAALPELFGDPPYCQVVSFSPAGNEHYLSRGSSNQRRDLAPCRLEGGFGLLPKRMHGLGIAHLIRKIWQHRRHYFWCRARRRAVIEINKHKSLESGSSV